MTTSAKTTKPTKRKKSKKRKKKSAQLSCKSAEHYTPETFIDAARYTLERIDLDPGSCEMANQTVKAARFYSAEDNGLSRPWGGRVYVNPPGDKLGLLVKAFWRRACEHALHGGPGAVVIWAGYSLEQLGSLQRCQPLDSGQVCPAPTDFPHVIIKRRIRWINGETGDPGKQPTHRSFFCLLGGDKHQRARFRERLGPFGKYQVRSGRKKKHRNLSNEIRNALRELGPMSNGGSHSLSGRGDRTSGAWSMNWRILVDYSRSAMHGPWVR